MLMNKSLQILQAKKRFSNLGLDSDSVDWDALIDSNLHLDENITALEEHLAPLLKNVPAGIDARTYFEKLNLAIKKWMRYKFRHPETTTSPEQFLFG